MSNDVKAKIKKIVADHLGIEEEKVTEDTDKFFYEIEEKKRIKKV